MMRRSLIILILLSSTISEVRAQTLPLFEIIPYRRDQNNGTPRNVYAAIKIDRKNNQVSSCGVTSDSTASYSGSCHVTKGTLQLQTSSVAVLRNFSGANITPNEFWTIDLNTGTVQFCIKQATLSCIDVPDM